MLENNSKQEISNESLARMGEFQVSQDFVNSFFVEVLKAEKKHELKKVKVKKEKEEHSYFKSIKHRSEEKTESELLEEAEQIQELEEKPLEVPVPIFRAVPRPMTLSKIVLPPPPRPPILTGQPQIEKPLIINVRSLNNLIQDSQVTLIQCDGANVPVKANKQNKSVITEIILSEQEIMDFIRNFAARAQVPLTEPIFRAQIQGLAITAIISPYTGSRFVIVKR